MTDFLMWFIASFVATFGVSFLYCKLCCSKVSINLKIIFVFLVGVIFLSLIKFFDLTYLNFLAYFLYYPFLFYVIEPKSIKLLIYYTIIIWFYGVVLDFLIMLILSILNFLY